MASIIFYHQLGDMCARPSDWSQLDFKCIKALKSHNSVITKLDWSKDSRHIRSTDKGYELLFFDVDTDNLNKSKHNPHATSLKDIEWATNSCVLTWGTKEVWDTDMDGSDVNTVDVLPLLPVYMRNNKLIEIPVLGRCVPEQACCHRRWSRSCVPLPISCSRSNE